MDQSTTPVPYSITPPSIPLNELSKFDLLVKQNELLPQRALQLKEILTKCEIVLLCDDSESMSREIAEPNSTKKTTRWLELKKLAATIIEFVTAINPDGLDIYFMNRALMRNVTDMSGLQVAFSNPPAGKTPLIGTLKKIYRDKNNIPDGKMLLIIVVTDGEQSDGSNYELENVLTNKNRNVHISFVECTDREEEMEYLDRLNGRILNFDNTDDYREELARVKRVQGPNFKFDYTDYVIKILLATFDKYYFNLDRQRVATTNQPTNFTPKWQPPQDNSNNQNNNYYSTRSRQNMQPPQNRQNRRSGCIIL